MSYSKSSLIALAICWAGYSSQASQPAAARPIQVQSAPTHFPNVAAVEKIVSLYMEELKVREEDDLLSQSDVLPLLDELEDIGWNINKTTKSQLQDRVLPDSDWLVRTLRTRQGTRFMRDMSSFQGGYDRLHRWRLQPHGKKELLGIINSPGGARLIEYLTTTKQGRRAGAGLTNRSEKGAFNAPTNLLFTKEDVSGFIRQMYSAEASRRLEATSVRQTTRQNRPRPPQSTERPSNQPLSPAEPTDSEDFEE